MNNGGPAFPSFEYESMHRGMSLRDYFAANMSEDDRLVKCIRAMDDEDLAIFACHPDLEREDWYADAEYHGLDSVQKIIKRLRLEAKAIAIARYMQADAMIEAREDSNE